MFTTQWDRVRSPNLKVIGWHLVVLGRSIRRIYSDGGSGGGGGDGGGGSGNDGLGDGGDGGIKVAIIPIISSNNL